MFISVTAGAKADACVELGLEQAFPPIANNAVVACFVFKPVEVLHKGQISRDPDGLAVYSVTTSNAPVLVYEFPYAGTEGSIEAAFYQSVGNETVMLVIHRFDPPRSWDVVSDLYDVSVMRLEGGGFVYDKKLSRFFGLGGDLVDNKRKKTYTFPYKSKVSVKRAINSDLFKAVAQSALIEGTIFEKTFLHEGDTEPRFARPANMYLVPGDIVEVIDTTGGWCKVSFSPESTSNRLQKWIPSASMSLKNPSLQKGRERC
jgi:hypothetical protein